MVDLTLPFLGEPSGPRWQYPFGDLQRAGAVLATGSDWPVSSPTRWPRIHAAVTRTASGEDGRVGHDPFLPEQALDLDDRPRGVHAGSRVR